MYVIKNPKVSSNHILHNAINTPSQKGHTSAYESYAVHMRGSYAKGVPLKRHEINKEMNLRYPVEDNMPGFPLDFFESITK